MMDDQQQTSTTKRAWATFYLVGTALNVYEVTATLAIVPTRSWQGDEPRAAGTDHPTRPLGLWESSSEGRVHDRHKEDDRSTNLDAHITWLLDQVEPIALQVATFRARGGMDAGIRCFWQPLTQSSQLPALRARTLARLGALDLNLHIEIVEHAE